MSRPTKSLLFRHALVDVLAVVVFVLILRSGDQPVSWPKTILVIAVMLVVGWATTWWVTKRDS
jgi:hypothetical protein